MGKRDYKGELEEYLTYTAMSLGLDWTLEREYRFHPERKWRFDWCWPAGKIAIEYDGIMFRNASHSSMSGILRDSEKANEAQRLGWRIFRANAKSVDDGTFYALIDSVLAQEATAA